MDPSEVVAEEPDPQQEVVVWYKRAWRWLCANWQWLFFPLGLALWFLGRASVRGSTVVSGELAAHENVRRKLDEVAAGERKASEAKHAAAVEDIRKEHDSAVSLAEDRQAQKVDEVRGDADKTNEFLKQVSHDVRKQNTR